MAVNRYFGYQPLQAADYSFKLPMDYLGKTLESLQEKSSQNYASISQLPSLIHVNALEGKDTEARNKKEQEYRNKIDALVKNSNGDYSGLTKDIYGLKASLQKEMTTGDLAAISNNYNQYSEYQKKMLDQKDLPRTYASLALRKTLDNYNQEGGYGGIDPVTGDYKRVAPIYGQGYDFQGKLGKVGEFKDITEENAWREKAGDWYKDIKTKTGGVAYDRAYSSLFGEVVNDPLAQEHISFLQRIGMPKEEINKMVHGIVDAEAIRRTKSISEKDVKYTFDKAVELAQEEDHFRRREARQAKEHADKMEAFTEPYLGRQVTLGSKTEGDYASKIDFSGGTYDKYGNKLGWSDGVLVSGSGMGSGLGSATYRDTNSTALTGKEKIDFNHPTIKNNPLAQKALIAAYIKNTGDSKLLAYAPEKQNQMISAWADQDRGKAQTTINKELGELSKNYNTRSVKGYQVAGKYAETLANDMLRMGSTVAVRDMSSGQKFGTLNDLLKAEGISPDDITTDTNNAKVKNKLHVVADSNGEYVITLNKNGRTKQLVVSNFDESREGTYSKARDLTSQKPITNFNAPIMRGNTYSNRTSIDKIGDQSIFRAQTLDIRKGDMTSDGIKVINLGIDKSGNKMIEVEYPNGGKEVMPFEAEDDLLRTTRAKDKSFQKRTAKATATTNQEFWRGE